MEKRRIKILIFSAAIACSLCVTGCSDSKEPSSAQIQQEGSPAGLRTFTADTLDKGTFTQEDLMEKDVTVINFWSLHCAPCIKEMPDIAAFERSLPDNVQVLTACLDGEDMRDGVEAIMEEAGFEGTTLLGGDGDYQELCGMIQYTPTTVFVDKEGNVAGDFMIGGQVDLAESYGNAIDSVLESAGKEGLGLGEDP